MRLLRKITYAEFSEFVQEKKRTYNIHMYVYFSTILSRHVQNKHDLYKKKLRTSLIIMIIMRILSNYESYFPGGTVCVYEFVNVH